MKAINQKNQLATKIALLKNKQAVDFSNLKNQYHVTIDSFKPINLIKNSIEEALAVPSLKSNIIKGTVGFGVNYLVNNFVNPDFKTTKKSILGKTFQFIVRNFIVKKNH